MVSQCASLLVLSGVFFIAVFAILFFLLRLWIRLKVKSPVGEQGGTVKTIGFFHPYCNAGGGGERVLWVAIRALQKKIPDVKCVVYTGDTDAKPEEILARARQRFNIVLPKPIEFIYLTRRPWVEACKYPYFTLLGQSLGSVYLGFEALMSYVPDMYIDTMGYAFVVPLFKYLGGCKVVSYVHFPTISTDMLERVSSRANTYNNAGFIANSAILSSFKLMYYKLFAYLYGVMGKRNDLVMVNSTWTYNHIQALWSAPGMTHIVYPPCDVSKFTKLGIEKHSSCKEKMMVSIAQFRPEKNHSLQVRSFSQFIKTIPETERRTYKLVLVGGCRNDGDAARVESLKKLSKELDVENFVELRLNVDFEELKSLMQQSILGLHSMWNEHFGIGVVELMAAGTVIIANDSGGPKLDIVVPCEGEVTGFLADDENSYVQAMRKVIHMSDEERYKLRTRARGSVSRFSDEMFEQAFLDLLETMLQGS